MQWNGRDISANVSLLFSERPYRERFQAAAESGFHAVESWWPFPEPHPGEQRLDELIQLILDAGIQLTGLNFFAGDMPAGERGLARLPARHSELYENIEAVLYVARETGCAGVNLLYGQPAQGKGFAETREAALPAYQRAGSVMSSLPTPRTVANPVRVTWTGMPSQRHCAPLGTPALCLPSTNRPGGRERPWRGWTSRPYCPPRSSLSTGTVPSCHGVTTHTTR